MCLSQECNLRNIRISSSGTVSLLTVAPLPNKSWTILTLRTGDAFASTCPLWIADPNGNSGKLPAGWTYYTFWQWAASGVFPGDQDVFNGAVSRLKVLATG